MDINNIIIKKVSIDLENEKVTAIITIPGQYRDSDILDLKNTLKEAGIEATLGRIGLVCDTCDLRSKESYADISSAIIAANALGWFIAGSDLYCPSCRKISGLV